VDDLTNLRTASRIHTETEIRTFVILGENKACEVNTLVHTVWITNVSRFAHNFFLSVRMNLISTCGTYVPFYKVVVYKASLRKAVTRKCKKD